MSQCVPSWDLDDTSFPLHVPSLEFDGYEVAELTWHNGQLGLHGLANKPAAAGGTLESVVNQAAFHFKPKPAEDGGDVNELAPWFDHHAAGMTTMDALVPVREHVVEPVPEIGACAGEESTRVGSCSGAIVPGSESESNGRRIMDGRRRLTAAATTSFDTYKGGFGVGGSTSTSEWSQENAKSTSVDDSWEVRGPKHRGQSHPIMNGVDSSSAEIQYLRLGQGVGKSSVSARRHKAAAIHSRSERRRRDRINQRMKTLQKMVPNSSKTDKASMLDEVIEYVKQLQAQLQITQMYISQMMTMFQPFFNINPNPMMGMMRAMDINSLGRMPPASTRIPSPAAFMPIASWNNFPANRFSSPDFIPTSLANPMENEAYSRMAALYQQFQHPFGSKR